MKIRRSYAIAIDLSHEEVTLACQEYLTRKFAESTGIPVGWPNATLDYAIFTLETSGVFDQVSASLFYNTPPLKESPAADDRDPEDDQGWMTDELST